MLNVAFEEICAVDDALLEYAVIISRYQDKWLLCRHHARNTWEVPGGHREPNEAVLDTARRELFEETGALEYELSAVCAYSVTAEQKSYGLLFYAEIKRLGLLPDFEMKETGLFEELPKGLTYPLIQPVLLDKVKQWLSEN